MTLTVLFLAAAFLLGSIPSALIVARRRGIDLRTVGSGNPGATNVYRTLGPRDGLLVLGADIAKGALAVVCMRLSGAGGAWWLAAAAMAILGHIVSPFMGFRGGKGVAAGGGAVIALAPLIGLIVIGVFAGTLFVTRMVSVGSVLAALALPVAVYLLGEPVPWFLPVSLVISLLVVVRHRDNMLRVMRGEEKHFNIRGGASRAEGGETPR